MELEGHVERVLGDVLQTEHGVLWAYLFGSAARGEPARDVDIAIMPQSDALTRLTDLGRLQVRLSRAVDRDVDLLDLRRADLIVVTSVLRDRRVLLDRDRARRHQWEAEAASRALDYEPVRARYSELRRERLHERRSGAG